MTTPYPPEPWELCGQLYASALLVRLADVPVDLPPGCRPIRIGPYGIVGVAWVSYEPGGVLQYRELMATLLVRRGWRIMPTINRIWVDSLASLQGGRRLWGIPKDLAQFDFTDTEFAAKGGDGPIATARMRPRLRLPGRWTVRFRVVQWLDGAAKLSPVRARAGVVLARTTLDPDPAGPLSYLAGRSPFASFTLRDFRMRFGVDIRR